MPTVQETNRRAAESLRLLPAAARGLMRRLHDVERRRGGPVAVWLGAAAGERLWRLLRGQEGADWGIGSVRERRGHYQYRTDAGFLVLSRLGSREGWRYRARYTSHSRRVWE